MEFFFIAYILISIVLISGSFFYNYVAGKTAQAGILGIGLLVAAIVFGVRWFPGGRSVAAAASGAPWPPNINVCPDFLSLTKVGGKFYCVDPIGVSRRNLGGMERWSSPDQIDPKYLFNLYSDLGDGPDRLNKLYDECKAKAVTWEGVWDGSVGLGGSPPRP